MPYGRVLNMPVQRFTGFKTSLPFYLYSVHKIWQSREYSRVARGAKYA